MLEKNIEQYLLKKVKQAGGLCWKFTSPGTAGVPDRIILYKGKVIFVELKRPGGKARPLQLERQRQIRAQGIPAIIIDDKTKVDDFLCKLQAKNMNG